MKLPDLLPEIAALEIGRREALVDNVLFWALVEHLAYADTSAELDHVGRRILEGYRSGKLSADQFKKLVTKGMIARGKLHGPTTPAA